MHKTVVVNATKSSLKSQSGSPLLYRRIARCKDKLIDSHCAPYSVLPIAQLSDYLSTNILMMLQVF
jgi:hypothetical protein